MTPGWTHRRACLPIAAISSWGTLQRRRRNRPCSPRLARDQLAQGKDVPTLPPLGPSLPGAPGLPSRPMAPVVPLRPETPAVPVGPWRRRADGSCETTESLKVKGQSLKVPMLPAQLTCHCIGHKDYDIQSMQHHSQPANHHGDTSSRKHDGQSAADLESWRASRTISSHGASPPLLPVEAVLPGGAWRATRSAWPTCALDPPHSGLTTASPEPSLSWPSLGPRGSRHALRAGRSTKAYSTIKTLDGQEQGRPQSSQ